jgi:glutaredoxin
MRTVTLFTAESCKPCHVVKKLVESGAFEIIGAPGAEVEIVDVETDAGFPSIEKHKLTGVPEAIDDSGARCRIELDEETQRVLFTCGAGDTG